MSIQMEKTPYGGWPNCIRLSNKDIDLIATTDVGPRIIRMGFKGEKNLFKEFADHIGKTGGDAWRNYGGHRLWHAPEIRPRSYVPDNTPIEFKWDEKTLKLIQPVEAPTGVQKEIEVTLDPKRNRVTVLHRLTNKGSWAIEAAPWALTVMQGPGRAILPQEPAGTALLPVRPMVMWGYTDMADKRWSWGTKYIQLSCDPAATKPQKIGIGNTLGWAAYLSNGQVFIKRLGFDPKATYPDLGCNTETFTRGDMLEVESVGPLTRIEPNGQVEHLEEWFLFRGEVGQSEAELDAGLMPLVSQTSL